VRVPTTAVAILALTVTACSGASHPSSQRAASRLAATSRSTSTTTSLGRLGVAHRVAGPPGAPRSVPRHQVRGTASTLVPGTSVALLACRYHGFNQPQPFGSLAASVRVAPSPVARALNREPPINPAIYHCPMDAGELLLLLFQYPDGSLLQVHVSMQGCEFATNGDRTVSTPELILTSLGPKIGHDIPR